MITRPLIQNALFIPELKAYLKSCNVHDYATVILSDGAEVSIDGGLDYMRRSYSDGFDKSRVLDMCLYSDSPFDEVQSKLLWGTYGKDGKSPRCWVPLWSCETDHLKAILTTQRHIKGSIVERVALSILRDRA